MGNVAFRTLGVSLLDDASLDSVEAGTSDLLRGPMAKVHSELHHHPSHFDIVLHMDPGERDFLQFKLQKTQQLQLRTLFHACKKATAAAAADAASSPAAAPAPLPRVPVLSLRIQVQQGALHSAYLAADMPFPTRSRHTWAHEPFLARNQTVSRREVSSRFRTVAHQYRDLRWQADPRLPQQPDPDLGPTGCVMDMLASDTDFFGVQRYFLTINAAPEDPNARAATSGVTIVRVTAQIELRTVAPPKEEVLKAQAEAKATLSKQQQLIRAATVAQNSAAAAEAAKALALRKEEQRHAEEAAAEQRRIQETEAAEAAAAVATARAARALAEAAALAGSPEADDPFAESTSGTPRARMDRDSEEKYPDPFGDEPSLSKRGQDADDPFASMDDAAQPNRTAAAADPFASFPPSPARGPRVAGGGGRNPLDELDSLQNTPAASARPSAPLVPALSLSSSTKSVVNRELDMATRPAAAALSPNLLESLPSRRPSASATPNADNSLSLAGTPVVKPVKRDTRVLDNLPTLSGARVQINPPARSGPVVSRAELSVPLSSLPDRAAPRKVDVLSSVPTPPISPRSRQPPAESISAMPTPIMRPKASPAVLDSVAAPPPAAKPNPRVLDALPSPAAPRPKLAADLDAVPLPPLSLSGPRTAPPAGPNALDEIDAPPRGGGGSVSSLRKPAASSSTGRSPQKPVPQLQQRNPLDESADSLFGDSPARPASSKRQPAAASALDDDAFWDSSPAPAAARRAPTVPAAARSTVSFARGLDDDLLSMPDAPKRVTANFNVLDEL